MFRSKGKTPLKLLYRHGLARAALAQAAASEDASADVVVWVPPLPPLRYLGSDNELRDAALCLALHEHGTKYRILRGPHLGSLVGQRVFLHIGQHLNPFGFTDYSAIWPYIIGELEEAGNTVFPSKHEAALWENKAHMHRLFEARGVQAPTTELVPCCELEAFVQGRPFPFLLKEVHSCSSWGVHKVTSAADVHKVVAAVSARNPREIVLVQELLDMRRDLRAIVVGDEVVSHYWRINLASEWKPTATGHGSRVDFGNFPERWRGEIVGALAKLGVRNGAFDVAWRGDNLETEPLFLEVSPQYQPNPAVAEGELTGNYGEWKKAAQLGPAGYDWRFFDTLKAIARKYVKTTLG